MQTFLPYPVYCMTAKVLDNKRLGKQRVEAKQILLSCLAAKGKYGWQNHPAVKMWIGYERSLVEYGINICSEWIDRGFNDSLLPWFQKMRFALRNRPKSYPSWKWNEELILSHRSNLLRKDNRHYKRFFPHTIEGLPYYWPVK